MTAVIHHPVNQFALAIMQELQIPFESEQTPILTLALDELENQGADEQREFALGKVATLPKDLQAQFLLPEMDRCQAELKEAEPDEKPEILAEHLSELETTLDGHHPEGVKQILAENLALNLQSVFNYGRPLQYD